MTIGFDFMRGMAVGMEFPGDGVHMVLHLLILRILFLSDDIAEDWSADE